MHAKLNYVIGVDTSAVLNRIRFTKYLDLIRQLFGNYAVLLTEELIFHGRRTAPALIQAVAQRIMREAEASNEISFTNESEVETELQTILERVIQGRYFVTVAPLDIDQLKASREKEANRITATNMAAASGQVKPKRRSSTNKAISNSNGNGKDKDDNHSTSSTTIRTTKTKRKAAAIVASDELPIELRMMIQNEQELAQLAKQHGVNYNIAQSQGSSSDAAVNQEVITQDAKRVRKTAGGRGSTRGRGRRVQRIVADELPTAATEGQEGETIVSETIQQEQVMDQVLGPQDDVLWRIGDDQFLRELRRQKCITFAGQKMSKAAADVVAAMLTLSAPKETGIAPAMSEPVTIRQICDKSKLEMAPARRLIDLMRTDTLHMITKASEEAEWTDKASFSVNMESIIGYIKSRAIHSIVEARYGTEAARICELLLRKKYLDQQKIGEMAILPAKTARERLYQLLRAGWVTYIDISKRSDFNIGATYWFWTLDEAKVQEHVLEHLYQGAYNLRVRRQHQFAQGKDLVEFAQANAEESARLERLSTMLARLDKALLQLDDTILLFAKF